MDNNLYFNTGGDHNYRVYYQPGMDGGGTWFGQEYITQISRRWPARRFRKCFEWCSGPGYIGFGIMGHELADTLCLADIHQPTIEYVKRSIRENNCADRVSAYVADSISTLPESELFDLVVGNPPHFPSASDIDDVTRLESDVGWNIHQEFFANIGRHLTPDGVILLQENELGSTVEDFRVMIESAGLEIRGHWRSPNHYREQGMTKIYYIEIGHAQV